MPYALSSPMRILRLLLPATAILLMGLHAHADTVQTCLDEITARLSQKLPSTGKTSHETLDFHLVDTSQVSNRCEEKGDLKSIRRALRHQVGRCAETKPADKETFKLGCKLFTRAEWCLQTNKKLLKIANSSPDFPTYLRRIRSQFDWYQSEGLLADSSDGIFKKGETQFTGYYTPVIKASRTKRGVYKYPVYSTPKDLVQIPEASPKTCGISPTRKTPIKWCRKNPDGTFSPYFTRAEIEAGALRGRSKPIAYVADRTDLAFMMVQGSATLELDLPNGRKQLVRANYGGMNGRPLQMLGRVIRCDGGQKEDFSTMEGIKAYLKAQNPKRMLELLNYDQSYVFFKEEAEGPMGFEGVPVTARHSIAVDRSLIPPGGSVLIDVEKTMEGPKASCSRLSTFALAQDTGGAIKGAHVDWYLGTGSQAGDLAGKMNNAGSLYVAVPKRSGRAIPNCTN
jgi:membrane-bound lytic murein transglycosylase